MIKDEKILGAILAGGQSRRMNSEPKWRLSLGEQSMIEHILQRFAPQVCQVIINSAYADLKQYGCPVINDSLPDSLGPLAGILTGLEYAQKQGFEWLATCPCDSPFLPLDYVDILVKAITSPKITNPKINSAVIESGGRVHGVFGLWSVDLAADLREALQNTQMRAIGHWIEEHTNTLTVEMVGEPLAFFNVNTPEDWEKAQRHYSLHYPL